MFLSRTDERKLTAGAGPSWAAAYDAMALPKIPRQTLRGLGVVGQHSPSPGDPRQLEKRPHKNRWQPKQHRHRGFPRDELAEMMTVSIAVCEYPFGYR